MAMKGGRLPNITAHVPVIGNQLAKWLAADFTQDGNINHKSVASLVPKGTVAVILQGYFRFADNTSYLRFYDTNEIQISLWRSSTANQMFGYCAIVPLDANYNFHYMFTVATTACEMYLVGYFKEVTV